MVILLHVALGASLASCTGLRAFLPLFLVGLAARFGVHLPLNESFAWLSSTPALIAFGSASVLELLGDKFPAVDHVLDTCGTVVRPVAGILAVACILNKLPPLYAVAVGLILGAPISFGFNALKGGTRALSTVFTLSSLNPLLSFIEDAIVVAVTVLSFLLPIIAMGIMIILAITLYRLLKNAKGRRRCELPPSPA
jgi:hypothetical protein